MPSSSPPFLLFFPPRVKISPLQSLPPSTSPPLEMFKYPPPFTPSRPSKQCIFFSTSSRCYVFCRFTELSVFTSLPFSVYSRLYLQPFPPCFAFSSSLLPPPSYVLLNPTPPSFSSRSSFFLLHPALLHLPSHFPLPLPPPSLPQPFPSLHRWPWA